VSATCGASRLDGFVIFIFMKGVNMTELEELAQKFPDHIIIEKCLWNGKTRVEIDHINNDINNPLDYVKAFRRLTETVSEI
jgi:hypothetical protein